MNPPVQASRPMRPVYIAAPFAPAQGLTVEDNVIRARMLTKVALENGYAPVAMHDAIFAGTYGQDESPTDRERGILVCCTVALALARDGGEFWVLELPDGTLSSGCTRESLWVSKDCPKVPQRRWKIHMGGVVNVHGCDCDACQPGLYAVGADVAPVGYPVGSDIAPINIGNPSDTIDDLPLDPTLRGPTI